VRVERGHGESAKTSIGKKSAKTITFSNKEEHITRKTLWDVSKGKWAVGVVLWGLDCVWKWGGARAGLQEISEYGEGFEGWVWRGSVVALSEGSSVQVSRGSTWVVK